MDSKLSDCLTDDSEHLSKINYDLLSDSDQSAHRFDGEISSVLHSRNSSVTPNFCLGRSTWDITANTEQLSVAVSPNNQYYQRVDEESPRECTPLDQRPDKKRKSEEKHSHNAKKHKKSIDTGSEFEVNSDVSSFECDVSSITGNSETTAEPKKNIPRKSMFPVMVTEKTFSNEDFESSFDVTKSQVTCDDSETSRNTRADKPRKSIYVVNSDSVLSGDVSDIYNVTFTKSQESTSNTCVSKDTNSKSKVHSGPRKSMFVPPSSNISSETSELEDMTFSKTLNSTKAGGMMPYQSNGDKSEIVGEEVEQTNNSLQDDSHANFSDLSSFEKSKSFVEKQRSKKSLFAHRTPSTEAAKGLKKTNDLEKSRMLEENSIGTDSLQEDSNAEFSEMSSFERSKSIVQKREPKKSIFVKKTDDSEIEEINTQPEISSLEDSHAESSEISSFERSKSIVQKRGPKKSIFVRKTDDSEIEEMNTQPELFSLEDSHAEFSEITSFEKSKTFLEGEDPSKSNSIRNQTTDSAENFKNHETMSSQEHVHEESYVLGCEKSKSLIENQYPRKSIYLKEIEIIEGEEELSNVQEKSSIIKGNSDNTESLQDVSSNNSEPSSFERSKSFVQKQQPKKSIFVKNNQNTKAVKETSNQINWEKSSLLEENSKYLQGDSLADFSQISSFETSKSFAQIQQPKKSLFAIPVINESNSTLNDPANFDFEKSKSSQDLPKKSMFVKQNTLNESDVSDVSDFASKSTIEQGTRKSVFYQANENCTGSDFSNMTDISDCETSKLCLSNTLTKNNVDHDTFTLTVANNDTYTIGSANQTAETGIVEKNNETFTANNPVSSLDILPIISSGIYNTENIPGFEVIYENQNIVQTETLESNLDKTNNLITQEHEETLKGDECEDLTITMDKTHNDTLELSDSQVSSLNNKDLADASVQIDETCSTLQKTNEFDEASKNNSSDNSTTMNETENSKLVDASTKIDENFSMSQATNEGSEFDESSKNNSSVGNSTTINETENSKLADTSPKIDENLCMSQEINEASKFDESSKINSSEENSTTMNETKNSEISDVSESSKINSLENNSITNNETNNSVIIPSHNQTTSAEKSEVHSVSARIDEKDSTLEKTNEAKECHKYSKINSLPADDSIIIGEVDNELSLSQTGYSEKSGTNEATECEGFSEINTSADHSMTMEESDNTNVEASHNLMTSFENSEYPNTSIEIDANKNNKDDMTLLDERDDGYRNVSKILNETSVTRYFNNVLEDCSADKITRMNCETMVAGESLVDKTLQSTLVLCPMLYEENLETSHLSLELLAESNAVTSKFEKNANATVNHTQLESSKGTINNFEKNAFTEEVLVTNEILKPRSSTRINENLESGEIMETSHQCAKLRVISLEQNAHETIKNTQLLISTNEVIEDIGKRNIEKAIITHEKEQSKGNIECIVNNHTSVFHESTETPKNRNSNNTQFVSPKDTVNEFENSAFSEGTMMTDNIIKSKSNNLVSVVTDQCTITENKGEKKDANLLIITNDDHVSTSQTSPANEIVNASIEKENVKKVTEIVNNSERKQSTEFRRKTLAVVNNSTLSNSSRLTRSLSKSKKTKKQIDLRRKTIAFTNVSRSYDSIVLNSTEDFSFDSYNGCSTRISMGVGNQTQHREDTVETNDTPKAVVAETQSKPIGAKISMEPKSSTIDETVQAGAKRGKRKALLFRSNLSLDNNPSSSSAEDIGPKSSPSSHQEKSTLNSLETLNFSRKSARLSEKSISLDKSLNVTLSSEENLNISGRITRSGLSEKSMNSTLRSKENINTSISSTKSAEKSINSLSLKSNEKLNTSGRSTRTGISDKSINSSFARKLSTSGTATKSGEKSINVHSNSVDKLNTSGTATRSGEKSIDIHSNSVDKLNTSGRVTRSSTNSINIHSNSVDILNTSNRSTRLGRKSIDSSMTSENHNTSEREIPLPQKSLQKLSSTSKLSETTPIQIERLESTRRASYNKFANVPMTFSPISKTRVNLTRQSSVSYNGSDDFNMTSGSDYLTLSQNVCETISVNSSDTTNSRSGSNTNTVLVNKITGVSSDNIIKSCISTDTDINIIDKLSKNNSVGVGSNNSTNIGTITSVSTKNASDNRSGSRNITGSYASNSNVSTNNHSDTTSSTQSRRRKQRTLLSTSTLMDPIDDTQGSSVNPENLTASTYQNAAYRTNKLLGNLSVQSKNRDASIVSVQSRKRDTSNLSVQSKNLPLDTSTMTVSEDGIESFKQPLLPKRYSQAAAASRSGSLRAGSSSEGISLSISNLLDTTDVSRLTQSQFLKYVNKNSTQISSLKSSTARKVKPSSASMTGDMSSSVSSRTSRSKTSLSNIDISSIARDKTENSNTSESQRFSRSASRRVSSITEHETLPTPPPPPTPRPRRASHLDYQSLVYSDLSHSEHPENSILRKILFTENSRLNESCATIASDVPARKPRKVNDNRLDIVLENGELYKPKPMFKHKRSPWIHKGFYKYLESKLKTKYKLKTRLVSEFCAKLLHEKAEELRLIRYAERDARSKAILEFVKNKLVGLGIIECNWDFFCFCHDYLPPPVGMCAVANISAKGYFDKLEYVESEDEEEEE